MKRQVLGMLQRLRTTLVEIQGPAAQRAQSWCKSRIRPEEPSASSEGPQEGKGRRTPRPKAKTPLTEYKKYYNRKRPERANEQLVKPVETFRYHQEVWTEKEKGGKIGANPFMEHGKGAKTEAKVLTKAKTRALSRPEARQWEPKVV